MSKGTGASAGIGIGTAVILTGEKLKVEKRMIADVEAEKVRFRKAVERSMEDIRLLTEDMRSRIGKKEAEILDSHLILLQDPVLADEIEHMIVMDQVCSEFAIETVCNGYAEMFASMDDELMQQRAADMHDIKTRMQRILLKVKAIDTSSLPSGSILVARDLTPSMAAGIDPSCVMGMITELGGKTSHSAIISRALEIPAVVSAVGILSEIKDGDELILDGTTGEIFINPEDALKEVYAEKREHDRTEREEQKQFIGKTSTTLDGVTVEVAGNIGNPDEAERVLSYDGEGIGLFRTEFLFMDRTFMPTEEEQFEAYKKVLSVMKGKPVTIRTLDIGGDKEIPYMGLKKEENPFLGYRAVRFCLDRKEDVFYPQLKALLRASAFGLLKIMVPFVTCIEEYRNVRKLVSEIMREFDEKQIPYNREIQIGIMVETAAASLMADVFAKEVDFFSIGTNDLIQYTMSVDRGNDKVSYLYSSLNPAVLRSIRHIIECGHKEGIKVGMCGEAACDPLMVPLLLAFGLDEFSMSASAILKVRKMITGYRIEDLKKAADEAMKLVTASEIEQFMKDFVSGMG